MSEDRSLGMVKTKIFHSDSDKFCKFPRDKGCLLFFFS